jgi:hypothetical protein
VLRDIAAQYQNWVTNRSTACNAHRTSPASEEPWTFSCL